mgnify:CR=1 FL=1
MNLVFIADNIRELETWAHRHADLGEEQHEHPLLATHRASVRLELTREEADRLSACLLKTDKSETKLAS